MTRLFFKLAFAGIRRRRLQTVLTVLVVAAASGALTIALGIGRVADKPWDRTFEETNAAHVTAFSPKADVDLHAVELLPGVVESTGVLPWISTSFRHDGKLFGLTIYGADRRPRVARPLLDDGRWPAGPGEVALERSFARFLGIGVGDTIVAGTAYQNVTPLRVTGVAIVAKGEAYPQSQPGNAFALEETVARIAPDRSSWAHFVGVRIAHPEESRAFLQRVFRVAPEAFADEWQADRADAKDTQKTVQVVLNIFGVLLFLAGGFVLATLIGGRVLAQVREIGVLKAAGLTPGQVARVFLIEQLALGVVGAVAGVALGTLATPLFVSSSSALMNASEVPPFDLRSAAIVVGVALAGVAVFTLGPAWRTGRRTTGSILAGPDTVGMRRSRLAPFSLPLPLALGLRDAFVRPGRALLTTLALALTVVSATATLGMEASFDVGGTPDVVEVRNGLPMEDPVNNDAAEEATLRPVVYGLDAVLLFVGTINLVATVLLSLRERVRDLGLVKAVGLTPRQVAGSFIASQTALAVGAVVIGIPCGLGLFRWAVGVTGGADEFAYPAWWWLALMAPAVVAIVAALAAPLARRASALSVVDALRYE